LSRKAVLVGTTGVHLNKRAAVPPLLVGALLVCVSLALATWRATPAYAYPTEIGVLQVTSGVLAPGAVVTAVGTGFTPGATVSVDIFGDSGEPVHLLTAVANAAGTAILVLRIPTDLSPGPHELRATGSAPDGGTLLLSAFFDVASGNGLPVTGGRVALLATSGGLLLAVGLVLVLVARVRPRRRVRAGGDLDKLLDGAGGAE
jgi:hypothetical protein